MRILTWISLSLISLYPIFTCDVSATSTQLISNSSRDDIISNICDFVNCGKGTCHLSSTEFLGFRCDCESGWKKPNFGSFILPTCGLPNCTVDLNCGMGSAPSQPPNVSNPCSLNFCGDGTCVITNNGSSHFRCQCNQGSANLLNDPNLFCFNKCMFSGDCNGLDLGFSSQSPPPPPPPSRTATGTAGEMLSCHRELHMLAMTIIPLIFQIWI